MIFSIRSALRCAGLCSREQALHFISGNRLRNFVLDRTLEKSSYLTKSGERKEAYRFTEAGKQWVREHIDSLSERKYYHSIGVEHDLRLMDKIISLTREQRETMRCENEIRDDFKERMQTYLDNRDYERYDQLYTAMQTHTVSMPDLCIGENEFYEVITSSYSQEIIECKVSLALAVGGTIQMDRI